MTTLMRNDNNFTIPVQFTILYYTEYFEFNTPVLMTVHALRRRKPRGQLVLFSLVVGLTVSETAGLFCVSAGGESFAPRDNVCQSNLGL